jgi:hypothetical protein
MFHDSPIVHPLPPECEKAIIMPAAIAPAPPQQISTPDAEQVRAVESVFTASKRENDEVSGLLGLWAGSILLHDLATATFHEPADEAEPEKQRPTHEEDSGDLPP